MVEVVKFHNQLRIITDGEEFPNDSRPSSSTVDSDGVEVYTSYLVMKNLCIETMFA